MANPPPPPPMGGFPAGSHDFFPAPMPRDHGIPEHRGHSPDPFLDMPDPIGSKSKKKKDGKNDDVEWALEGYSLEKAPPLPGKQASWSRIGKRQLPFDSKKLEALVKEHRRKTRAGPAYDFQQLGPKQQGVINQLIESRKQAEKNKSADWVLVDVQKWQLKHFSRPNETLRIQVVLKRQSKDKTKPNDSKSVSATGGYQAADIIDLSAPPKKEKKNKKEKPEDVFDLPFDFGLPEGRDDHGHGGGQDEGPLPVPQPQPNQPGPPHPGAIPIDPGFPPQPSPHFQHPQHFPEHPFQPDPQFVNPGQFSPLMQPFPELPRARTITTPAMPQLRRSNSARRLGELAGEIEELKGDLRESREEVEQVRHKIDRWKMSSNGSNESDSIFTRSAGYSTPPSSFSSHSPGRDFYRRKKSEPQRSRSRSRDRRHREERARREREEEDRQRYERERRDERERRYRDERIEVRPEVRLGYSYVPGIDRRIRRYSPERDSPRYVSPPPRLPPLAPEVDDYPPFRITEPARLPPSRMQRRLTDYGEAFEPARFTNDRFRRQQADVRPMFNSDSACSAVRRDEPRVRTGRRRDIFGESEFY